MTILSESIIFNFPLDTLTLSDLLAFKGESVTLEYVLQEFIVGNREYALHLLVKNGKIVKDICIEYHFTHDYPIKNKDTPTARCIIEEPFLDTWQPLLELINFEGICCINYKIKNGQPKLLEINPRIGGSLCEYLFSFVGKL